MRAFKDKDDFSTIEKQKIVLRTLILQTYITKHYEQLRVKNERLYHRPLLLTLVNSVDVEESDLKLFFAEIVKVANNSIQTELFNDSKKELLMELADDQKYEFSGDEVIINKDILQNIEYKDVLISVFNSNSPGNIEVLKIPGNKNEIIFKLQTSERPFALIKIGDISGWIKEKLAGFEIIESYENESVFKRINEDNSEINILMGSRAFYEGWDSNRPNIVLFINIGVGKDARKFVLQSVGRGVRIEPLENKRKRMEKLVNAGEIKKELYDQVQDLILPIESLYVFGTNADNLKEIVRTLKAEKKSKDIGNLFILNKYAKERPLLIPVYKTSPKMFAEEMPVSQFPISRKDYDNTRRYFNYIGEKISLLKYNCEVKVLKKVKESFSVQDGENYYDFNEKRTINDPELLLGRILDYFGVRIREFERFTELEDEIIHFRKITFTDGDHYKIIRNKIETMRNYPEIQKEMDKLFSAGSRSEYDKLQINLFKSSKFEMNNQNIKIKYLTNHYYHPLIVSEKDKVAYLNHIIDVESEREFVEGIEEYINKDAVLNYFDWWMFSKLDETLDRVYIPYYNSKKNEFSSFKPDFIFWLKKENDYTILFVDPKGVEHTDGFRKIDGFSRIFESQNSPKVCKIFSYNGLNIKIKLLLKARGGIADVPENYRRYWFDSFNRFAESIRE